MDMADFATRWIADWNSRDIDKVLAHYTPDAEFRSPGAVAIVGTGRVRGHDALRAYWSAALAKRPNLRFHLKAAFYGDQAIAIHYGDEIGRDVIETLVLNEAGRAIFGCACYAREPTGGAHG